MEDLCFGILFKYRNPFGVGDSQLQNNKGHSINSYMCQLLHPTPPRMPVAGHPEWPLTCARWCRFFQGFPMNFHFPLLLEVFSHPKKWSIMMFWGDSINLLFTIFSRGSPQNKPSFLTMSILDRPPSGIPPKKPGGHNSQRQNAAAEVPPCIDQTNQHQGRAKVS